MFREKPPMAAADIGEAQDVSEKEGVTRAEGIKAQLEQIRQGLKQKIQERESLQSIIMRAREGRIKPRDDAEAKKFTEQEALVQELDKDITALKERETGLVKDLDEIKKFSQQRDREAA